jgi:hypothetical protein
MRKLLYTLSVMVGLATLPASPALAICTGGSSGGVTCSCTDELPSCSTGETVTWNGSAWACTTPSGGGTDAPCLGPKLGLAAKFPDAIICRAGADFIVYYMHSISSSAVTYSAMLPSGKYATGSVMWYAGPVYGFGVLRFDTSGNYVDSNTTDAYACKGSSIDDLKTAGLTRYFCSN